MDYRTSEKIEYRESETANMFEIENDSQSQSLSKQIPQGHIQSVSENLLSNKDSLRNNDFMAHSLEIPQNHLEVPGAEEKPAEGKELSESHKMIRASRKKQ